MQLGRILAQMSSLDSLLFFRCNRVYGGSCKTSSFGRFPIAGCNAVCVAGMALGDTPTSLQDWRKSTFFVAGPTYFGHLLNPSLFGVAGAECVFLWIALSGLRQVVSSCKFRGRRGTSWECHADPLCVHWDFAWHAQSLGSILYMLHSALHSLHLTLHVHTLQFAL